MSDDENGDENPERSESWDDLPEGMKEEKNVSIAANGEGEPEGEYSAEALSSGNDSDDDDSNNDE